MHRRQALLTLSSLAVACGAPPRGAGSATSAAKPHVDDAALSLFDAQGLVEGTFVLRPIGGREPITLVGSERAEIASSPASTFKIPSSIIGLATGVITDEHFKLPWDGKHYDIEDWNRDQDLQSAIAVSCVWYFQEIARRIGKERMADYLAGFDYGNRDISAGIDRFWLGSSLTITPVAQTVFLEKLRLRTLPVHPPHLELVERLLVLEQGEGWVLRGKTGTLEHGGRTTMWLVGIADHGSRAHTFALRASLNGIYSGDSRAMRRKLAKQLLVRLGALPKSAIA